MRDIVLLVFVIGILPVILRRPFVGVLMWCWVSYMLPHKLGWGFMSSFPLAMLVALVFFVSFVFTKENKTNIMRTPIFFLVILDVWFIFTFLVNPITEYAVYLFKMAIKVQLFTLFSYILLTNKERLHQMLWVITLSIGFYGTKGGIVTILSGGSTRIWGPPGGFFEGNNELGLSLLVITPILYYLSTTLTNKWLKYGVYTMIVMSLASVLGTQSRGALVALCCCLFFFWLKSNHKVISLVGLMILSPIGYNFMPDTWHDRMSTIIETKEEDYDGSVQGRFNAWRMAFNLANDRFLGGGFDSFGSTNFYIYAPDPDDVHDAHSIYFKILANHGYIGFFIFMLMWLSSWIMANKINKISKQDDSLKWAGMLARMLQISLIAFASGGTFLGLSYFDLPYHMLVCIVALYNIVLQERKALEQKDLGETTEQDEQTEAIVLAPGQQKPKSV